jgi:hypothetical protein
VTQMHLETAFEAERYASAKRTACCQKQDWDAAAARAPTATFSPRMLSDLFFSSILMQ